jgi:hypothetical protein
MALTIKLGFASTEAPWTAAAAVHLARRLDNDESSEERRQQAVSLLYQCALARDIPEAGFLEWPNRKRFLDRTVVLPALEKALDNPIGYRGWLFDRAGLTAEPRL